MDLQSLVMHSVWLYFKASQQDARLWFLERSRAGNAVSRALWCRLWRYLPKELCFSGGCLSKSQVCVRDKLELHFRWWIWGGAQDLKSGLKSHGLIILCPKREVQFHPGMLHCPVILAGLWSWLMILMILIVVHVHFQNPCAAFGLLFVFHFVKCTVAVFCTDLYNKVSDEQGIYWE